MSVSSIRIDVDNIEVHRSHSDLEIRCYGYDADQVFEEIKQELDSGDLFEAAFKEMDECDILDKLSSDDILQYIRRSMTGDQLLDLARDILDDHKVDTTAVDAARVIEKI